MPRVARKPVSRDLPTDFADLVAMLPPMAIHDEQAYENTIEMIDALTCLPRPSKGQSEYLDTLSVLVDLA